MAVRSKLEMVDLLDIQYSAFNSEFSILVKEPDMPPFRLVSRSVIYVRISNSPDGMETPTIIDLFIAQVHHEAATELLNSFGYGWADHRQLRNLQHMKIEGGIVMDVLFEGDLEEQRNLGN